MSGAMKCPLCGREVVLSYQTGRMMCPSCGWGAEHGDPEVAGEQRIRRARSSRQDVTMLIVTWLVAGGLVAGLYYVVFHVLEAEPTANNIGAFFTVLAVYSALGYLIRPQVDRENLGWLGGLVNNPFTFRDNVERWKLQWLILLFPGRIIGGAVVGLFRLIFSSRKPKEPPFQQRR